MMYRFNSIPSKSQLTSFQNRQADPKIYMDAQGKQNSQNNSEKEQRWSTHKSQFPNSPHIKSDRNQDTVVTGLRT